MFQNVLVVLSSKFFAGALVLGWSVLNLIEGIVDHHVLKIHNVNEASANPEFYNLLFTGFSVLLFAIGWWLTLSGLRGSRGGARYASAE